MMLEEWKDIPGYEPYQASNLGRIRGLRGVRKPYMSKKGYLTVLLNLNGKKVNRFVHGLIMLAWVGPVPDGMETCHRDNVKINNTLANLRYDTRSGNRKDSLFADQSPKAKLSVMDVQKIRDSKDRVLDLAEKFGVWPSSIYRIKRGDVWSTQSNNTQEEC